MPHRDAFYLIHIAENSGVTKSSAEMSAICDNQYSQYSQNRFDDFA